MAKLFTEAPATAVARSRKIAAESSRYNMGAMQRNFNVPTVALFFLSSGQPGTIPVHEGQGRPGRRRARVEGEVRGDAKADHHQDLEREGHARQGRGVDRSGRRPGPEDAHADRLGDAGCAHRAHGSERNQRASRRVNTTASITVTYTLEPKLGILVPAEMLETYEAPMRSAFTGEDNMTKVNCRATYSDFKRFETSAKIIVPK